MGKSLVSCFFLRHSVVVVTFFNHNFVNCKATLILAIKIYGASLLRVAGVTAGLAKSNGSLPPGL